MRMEAMMVEIASGDDVKMERMQEICSWFASKSELNKAVMDICDDFMVEEDERLMPDGLPKRPLEIVLWAIGEAESADPRRAWKWSAFLSRRLIPTGPEEFKVGVVMALQSPGTKDMLTLVEDVEPIVWGKAAKEVVYTLRRLPRSPRRSPRLLNFARSAATE